MLAGWWGLAGVAALAGGAGWVVGKVACRLLGGMTGDIYGAVNEIAEVAVLVAAAAITAGGAGVLRSPVAGWFEGAG